MCISSSFYDKEIEWYNRKIPRVSRFYVKHNTLININCNRQKFDRLIGSKLFDNISRYHLKEY